MASEADVVEFGMVVVSVSFEVVAEHSMVIRPSN
jgi:hypothetical protein